VGAWPIEPARIEAYLVKAMREAKVNTGWGAPNEGHEERATRAARDAVAHPPEGFEAFAGRVAAIGRRNSLAMTLLKLTLPGVPDLYQGDERECLSLVDPDNRRPVDWHAAADAKTRVVREALALRSRRPFGAYQPLELGADVCGFLRGDNVAVCVPLRAQDPPELDLPGTWASLLPGLPVLLLERT
jgi:(1->4)-alpha-D-glucan 1-alpha-D-glucosylmutase